VAYERVQSAVRYAGLMLDRTNPYLNYSLYTMYSQLGTSTVPSVTCATTSASSSQPATPTAALYDTAPTSTDGSTPSQPFWTPQSSSASCFYAGLFGLDVGDAGIHQDFIVSTQAPQVTATIAVPAYLSSILGNSSSLTAKQFFYRPIGVDVMMQCYAGLDSLVQASLTYSAASTSIPVALPAAAVTATTYSASGVCTNHT
jgi:hypothetical protein